MYIYDDFDRTLVQERVREFRDQVNRRLSGELTEEEFKPLRLMNGVYLQLHAYMLRIAIPYGTLSSDQMRMLAHVARRYDRNYGHFTTRQNIQFNWIKLKELPDAMADLAHAGLHGMQTSGNCVRNITTDQWAGVAPDEIEDPRIWAELLRQHLTLHPEFSFLPRKFKIALTASAHDRAAAKIHDIGLRMHRNGAGETGFEVMVGGGLGRTPFIGKTIRPFLPKRDLLSYVEAIMRAYNQYGRRDNIYKARIKILVHELGAEKFAREVEEEWQSIKDGALALDSAVVAAIPTTRRSRTIRPSLQRRARTAASAFGSTIRSATTSCPAMPSSRSRSSPKERPPATPPRSRWTPSPISRSATVSARFVWGMSRIWRFRTSPSAIFRRCGARSTKSVSPRPTSISSPTSSPAPVSTTAAWPTRARFRWPRRSRAASRISIWPAISDGCTSTSPAASMPAVTITSGISASSASRRTARNTTR